MSPDFKPAAIDAARQTMQHFIQDASVRWVALFGEMQIGKTAAILATFQRMYEVPEMFDTNQPKFFLITGMNAKEYRSQVLQDMVQYGCTFKLDTHRNLELRQLDDETKALLKNPAVEKVVAIDESSAGIKDGSVLDNFIRDTLQIDTSDGGVGINQQLMQMNIRIITISATPIAEMIRYARSLEDVERINNIRDFAPVPVFLKPGDGYYGVRDALREGCVFDNHGVRAWDPNTKTITPDFEKALQLAKTRITEERERGMGADDGRFFIVREPNVTAEDLLKFEAAVQCALGDSHHIVAERMNQSGDGLTTLLLETGKSILDIPPNKKVIRVIVITSMLRMAIRVPMTYVGLLWDNVSDNVDVAAQSLAGRRCGYSSKRDIPVYTTRAAVEAYGRLWERIESTRDDPILLREVFYEHLLNNNTSHSRPVGGRRTNDAPRVFTVVTEVDLDAADPLFKELSTVWNLDWRRGDSWSDKVRSFVDRCAGAKGKIANQKIVNKHGFNPQRADWQTEDGSAGALTKPTSGVQMQFGQLVRKSAAPMNHEKAIVPTEVLEQCRSGDEKGTHQVVVLKNSYVIDKASATNGNYYTRLVISLPQRKAFVLQRLSPASSHHVAPYFPEPVTQLRAPRTALGGVPHAKSEE